MAQFVAERFILNSIDSVNVIKCFDVIEDKKYFFQFYELCNGGDIQKLLNAKGKLKEADSRLILLQVIQGYKEIYKNNVLHRDLKLENLLIHFPNRQ